MSSFCPGQSRLIPVVLSLTLVLHLSRVFKDMILFFILWRWAGLCLMDFCFACSFCHNLVCSLWGPDAMKHQVQWNFWLKVKDNDQPLSLFLIFSSFSFSSKPACIVLAKTESSLTSRLGTANSFSDRFTKLPGHRKWGKFCLWFGKCVLKTEGE